MIDIDEMVESLKATIDLKWGEDSEDYDPDTLEEDLMFLNQLATLARLGLEHKKPFNIDEVVDNIKVSVDSFYMDSFRSCTSILTEKDQQEEVASLNELGRLAKLALENGLE